MHTATERFNDASCLLSAIESRTVREGRRAFAWQEVQRAKRARRERIIEYITTTFAAVAWVGTIFIVSGICSPLAQNDRLSRPNHRRGAPTKSRSIALPHTKSPALLKTSAASPPTITPKGLSTSRASTNRAPKTSHTTKCEMREFLTIAKTNFQISIFTPRADLYTSILPE